MSIPANDTTRPLADGGRIPAIGLGTSKLLGADCVRGVASAIAAGYAHIDTAVMYGNETEVGEGLRQSGAQRADLFVTTKVLPSDIGAGKLQQSATGSLGRLKLDYVDLLLIHWPNAAIPLARSIAALCEVQEKGLTRHIGVANFPSALLDEAVGLAATHGAKLVTNQCEYHPRLDQTRLLAFCRKHDVLLVSYCPLGKGPLLDDPVVQAIAKAKGRTAAQIMLRWHVQQKGVIAIPKSANATRQRENISVFDFALSDAEMTQLSAMARPDGRLVNPPISPAWD